MSSSISPALAEQLTDIIVSCGDEASSALVRLLEAVADPDTDSDRHQIAWIAIRKAFPYTSEYDSVIEKHCEDSALPTIT